MTLFRRVVLSDKVIHHTRYNTLKDISVSVTNLTAVMFNLWVKGPAQKFQCAWTAGLWMENKEPWTLILEALTKMWGCTYSILKPYDTSWSGIGGTFHCCLFSNETVNVLLMRPLNWKTFWLNYYSHDNSMQQPWV